MKRAIEKSPSEMGKEIKELENKYHEYYFLKKKYDDTYNFITKVLLVIGAVCFSDILRSIIECL